jgi:outer membrane lipoprotein SlyB
MEPTRAKGGWQRVNAGLLAAAVLGCAAHARGQAIRIPDFREPPRATVNPGEPCDRCGAIRSIREVQVSRPVPVPQAFQNDPIDQGLGSTVIVGAVVALPLGRGADKPFIGGVGTPEMRERFSETTYEVVIRLDNGGYTMVQRADGASFRVGDRVRAQGTQLELLAP